MRLQQAARCFGNPFILQLVLAAACWGNPAWGADSEASVTPAKAAAEGLFDEGVKLSDRGDYAAACPKFEASEALDPAVGTLLYLGDCYERVGKIASAWVRFREARSLAEAQGMLDRARIAATRADSLEPQLARATINVVSPAPAGLQIRVGSTLVPSGSWGVSLPFDSGDWKVVATAPGYEPYSTSLRIKPGAVIAIEIPKLRARPAETAPARVSAPPASHAGSTRRLWGGTTAVVGLVGLGAAGVFALISRQRNEDSFQYCAPNKNVCRARGLELRDGARDFADAATISASAGGALLITGAVLYLTAPSAADRSSFAVTPSFAQSSIGLSARGEY